VVKLVEVMRINDLNDLEKITPKEHETIKGLYYHPDDKSLLLSKDGKVFNLKTNRLLKPYFHENGRFQVSIGCERTKNKRTAKLHRLLARTFIGRPSRHLSKPFSELEVNHVDGNPANNDLNNLEWCTTKENIIHAHKCGLHSKDAPVLAKNLITGNIIKFTSGSDCAKTFRIHKATIWKHFKAAHSGKAYKDNHIFKLDDGLPWINYDQTKMYELGKGNEHVKMTVKDLKTNIIYIFNDMKEAAKHTGFPYIKLWKKLNKINPFKTGNFVYQKHK